MYLPTSIKLIFICILTFTVQLVIADTVKLDNANAAKIQKALDKKASRKKAAFSHVQIKKGRRYCNKGLLLAFKTTNGKYFCHKIGQRQEIKVVVYLPKNSKAYCIGLDGFTQYTNAVYYRNGNPGCNASAVLRNRTPQAPASIPSASAPPAPIPDPNRRYDKKRGYYCVAPYVLQYRNNSPICRLRQKIGRPKSH